MQLANAKYGNKNNLKVHNFSKLQELCVNILIKFFITTFYLFVCMLKIDKQVKQKLKKEIR